MVEFEHGYQRRSPRSISPDDKAAGQFMPRAGTDVLPGQSPRNLDVIPSSPKKVKFFWGGVFV